MRVYLVVIDESEEAHGALRERSGKVQSWYLDLTMVRQYWGEERFYHHTAPINMLYALHEALALVEDGWILRSDVIWHKPNAMPHSVKNRPTTDHEYIFMFSKFSVDYIPCCFIRHFKREVNAKILFVLAYI
mgnify:CR=1 FL=1